MIYSSVCLFVCLFVLFLKTVWQIRKLAESELIWNHAHWSVSNAGFSLLFKKIFFLFRIKG